MVWIVCSNSGKQVSSVIFCFVLLLKCMFWWFFPSRSYSGVFQGIANINYFAILFLFFLFFFSLTADSWYSFTSDSNVGPTEPTRETKRRVPFFLLCTVSCKRSLWSPGTDKTFHFGVLHNFDNVCPHFSFPSVSLILSFNHRYYGLLCSCDNHGLYKMTFSFFQTWNGSFSTGESKIVIKLPHWSNHFTIVGPFSYNMITGSSGTYIFVAMLLSGNLLHRTKMRNYQCKCRTVNTRI